MRLWPWSRIARLEAELEYANRFLRRKRAEVAEKDAEIDRLKQMILADTLQAMPPPLDPDVIDSGWMR